MSKKPAPKFHSSGVDTYLAIGDLHDKPGRCKDRFRILGSFASHLNETVGLKAIINIGDTGSHDSMSQYEQKGSKGDFNRTSFHEELNSLDEALALFEAHGPFGLRKYQTHGNHDHRVYLAADRNPKEMGDAGQRLEAVYQRFGWETRMYGDPLVLSGIEFVHTPLNVMGKPSNSDNPEYLHGRRQVRDLVVGHTHVFNVATVKKGRDRIRVVNLGTAMPFGLRESYTPKTTSAWDYGAVVLRVRRGRILSVKHFDMLELADMFPLVEKKRARAR